MAGADAGRDAAAAGIGPCAPVPAAGLPRAARRGARRPDRQASRTHGGPGARAAPGGDALRPRDHRRRRALAHLRPGRGARRRECGRHAAAPLVRG